MVYLQRISPANLAYALALRARGPVAAWQLEVPERLAAPFMRLQPYRLFVRDEWVLLHESCFDAWKDQVLPVLRARHACLARLRGAAVDFGPNAWQVLAQEFERFYLFVATACRHAGGRLPEIVPPWIALAFGREELARLFPQARFRHSRANELAEKLHEWGVSLAHVGRLALQIGRGLVGTRLRLGRRRVLWTGISAQEIPDAEGRLHFGFAAAYGHLPPEDVLYFPPLEPNPSQAAFLSRQRIATVSPMALGRLVSRADAIGSLAHAFAACLRGLVADSALMGPLRARFMARAPLWQSVARALGSDTYITSTSASWPERPETAVFKAEGLRTVIWSYSANTLWFTRGSPEFRDVSVIRSVVVCDEFWVWSEAVRRYYERRHLVGVAPLPEIVQTGTMMCGDVRHLALSPAVARAGLGISIEDEGFLLAVFDVPSVSEAWRHRFSGGPVSIEPEFGERFFAGIRALVERFPAIRLLLKLKRALDDPSRVYPDSLLGLLDPSGPYANRVLRVDVNCDPYLPIAAADGAIGMPMTSPVFAANEAGRPAMYFDPLGIVGQVHSESLRSLTVPSEPALIESVGQWLARRNVSSESHSPRLPPWPSRPGLFTERQFASKECRA